MACDRWRLLVVATAAARLLDEPCVRGVEMAPPGASQLFLANLTRCTVASLLAVRTVTPVVDEAAASAVLKADTLLLQPGVSLQLAETYGRLLRGGAHVLAPSGSSLSGFFRRVDERDGFEWYRRLGDGGSEALRLRVMGPNDGEIFAFDDAGATIRVRVRVPLMHALDLLPNPQLKVAADPDALFPLVVPLASTQVALATDASASSQALDAPSVRDDDIDLTLSNVPAGSHLITASLAFGDELRVVPDASASVMIDVVPGDLLRRRPSQHRSLGCARAGALVEASSSLETAAPTPPPGPRLRVGLADVLPSATVDGQRRVWIQRCEHWRAFFDVSYLLLYDDVVPPLGADAPFRRSLEDAGIATSVVAAPWHTRARPLQSRAEAGRAAVESALKCARGDYSALTAAQRAWVSHLRKIDVLLMHGAPGGAGGAVGDAARLACLGRLASDAGVGARLVDLPTVPSADVLTWRGTTPTTTRTGAAAYADALIVPSHYAAMATARAVEVGRGDGSLAGIDTPVVVLQPGVDERWFEAGKRRRTEETKTAVWVGRLDPDKSPLLFVRACALLGDADCLVVGDGPLRASLARRGNGTTRFLGHQFDGLADVVAAADVLVSTSVFPETFGLAPLEAAAAGVAVVAFGVAGMNEHVCDGVNALVPRAPTPAALADAIKQLLDDRPRARALGASGAQGAASHFGAKAAADRAAMFIQRTHSALADHDARCRAALRHNCTRPLLSPVYDDHSFLADVHVVDDVPDFLDADATRRSILHASRYS